MADESVWNIAKIFFRYFSPPKYIIVYDATSKTISRRKEKTYFFAHTVFVVLSFLLLVYFLLFHNSTYLYESKLKPLASVSGIFIIGLLEIYSVISVSVAFRNGSFFIVFNTLMRTKNSPRGTKYWLLEILKAVLTINWVLGRKAQEVFGIVSEDFIVLKWILWAIITSAVIPCILPTFAVLLKLDPASFILREIYAEPPDNFLLFGLKLVTLGYIGYTFWFGMASVAFLLVVQLYLGFLLIKRSFRVVELLVGNQLSAKNLEKPLNFILKEYRNQMGFIKEFLYINTIFQLLLPLIDEALFYVLPSLLLCGEIVLVTCNYATIKMYDSFPMPFFIAAPLSSCTMIIVMASLFPYAASVYENSRRSLFMLRSLKVIHTDKVWIRKLKAIRPLRFKVGSMFYAKRSTKTTYFSCCVNDTINAIILF